MIKRIVKYALNRYHRYRLRTNELSNNVFVNFKAKLTSVKADEYSRFADTCDVRHSCIGAYSTIGRYSKLTHVDMGKFCSISWDCTINATSHPYEHLTIHAFPYVPHAGNFVKERKQTIKRVTIGNDVWIGANSVIMPEVKIGDGAVIGANAVVTKDVPPYAIMVGVPAKVLKYRFNEEMIAELLEIKWWDIDRNKLEENIQFFQNPASLESLKELKKCLL